MHDFLKSFLPKSFTCLKEGITTSILFADLKAGVTVGIIALPLAMAFAIGSGVAPERGLITAIVAGFLISLLGGSRVQIGGPTGAFVVLIATTLQKHGLEGLVLATCLAGMLLILMGICQLGSLIRYIPYPVVIGFTAGIATVIFTSQIKEFSGLCIQNCSSEFFDRLIQNWQAKETFNPFTLSLSLASLAIIVSLRSLSKKIPGSIIAIIVATTATILFELPVATIESSFGPIPQMIPAPALVPLSFDAVQKVLPDAIAIALLGAIESLLSCVVADGMTGFTHKSNCELVGQGIANIGSSLFGGIPATGAIARTTANIQMGAKTPLAGMIHAITLFLLMLLLAPIVSKMPLGALAAILMVVAYNMSEIGHFVAILKGPLADKLVLLTTYFLTVCVDLTFAVQIGVLLAILMRKKRAANPDSAS